jgi:PAS domain S-box-containing protein
MAAAAPFTALTAYLAFRLVGHESADATGLVERQALTTAAEAEHRLAGIRAILVEVAQRPAVAALDPDRCDSLLSELPKLRTDFAAVFTLDAAGRRVCTAGPPGAHPPEQRDARNLLDAVQLRKRFTLGRPTRESPAGRWLVTAAQPLLTPSGEMAGVVGVSLDLGATSAFINTRAVPRDAVVAIVSPGAIVVARHPDPLDWVGRDVTASQIVRISLERRSGTARNTGLQGIDRFWAFAPVQSADWMVLAGIPVDVALGPAKRTAAWIGGLVALGFAFAVLLSIRFARRIAQPVVAIAGSVRHLDSPAGIGTLAPQGPAEVAEVATELNRLVEGRRIAACELRDSEARLQDAQRSAHDQLLEGRQRLDAIVTSAMDAIITIDSDHRITLFNPAAEGMFAVDAEQVIGRPLDSLIPQASRANHFAHVKRFGETGETSRTMGALGTVHGLRASGEVFPVEAAISQVAIGGRSFYTAILRDVSERKRAEREVQELNADLEERVRARTAQLEAAVRELHAFDYSISHDLRAPVNRIRGFTEALADSFGEPLGPEGRELLDRVRGAAESMDQLITDMLALSTISRGDVHRSDVDMSTLAHNVLASFQRADPTRQVELSVAPGIRVEADPGLMRIALENLLGNAWKFTSKKEEAAQIQLGRVEEAGEERLFVRDNGAGFDPAKARQLFEPFRRMHSQAEFGGTGIGLATVQRIVWRHGGRIWAQSAVGEGATFWFTLAPATDRTAARG